MNSLSDRHFRTLAGGLACAYLLFIGVVVTRQGGWVLSSSSWVEGVCMSDNSDNQANPLAAGPSCHEDVPDVIVRQFTLPQWRNDHREASAPVDFVYLPVDGGIALLVIGWALWPLLRRQAATGRIIQLSRPLSRPLRWSLIGLAGGYVLFVAITVATAGRLGLASASPWQNCADYPITFEAACSPDIEKPANDLTFDVIHWRYSSWLGEPAKTQYLPLDALAALGVLAVVAGSTKPTGKGTT